MHKLPLGAMYESSHRGTYRGVAIHQSDRGYKCCIKDDDQTNTGMSEKAGAILQHKI